MAFFPQDYKEFAYRPGDLFADREGEKYGLMRILAVDRIDIPSGGSITIRGQAFTAPEADFLLVIACALGDAEFASPEDALAAFNAGQWVPYLGHAPMRAGCITPAHILIGNVAVRDDELEGYRRWQADFSAGEAGIF